MKESPRPSPKAPRDLVGFSVFLLKEIWKQRRWALLPVWILLAALALLLLIGGSSAILPAIYVSF